MPKKRSSKEVIETEASKDPTKEYSFVKFPGVELIPITITSTESDSTFDGKKIKELEKIYGKKRNLVHTHPYDPKTTLFLDRDNPNSKRPPNKNLGWEIPFPSGDLAEFIVDTKAKSFYVAQFNSETGKFEGYFVIRKTRKTPQKFEEYWGELKVNSDVRNRYANNLANAVINDNPKQATDALDYICKFYNLRYKFFPDKEFEVKKDRTGFIKKLENAAGLEGTVVGIIAIIALIGSIFFLSMNITGNVIGTLNIPTRNIFGIILLVIGTIGVFLFLKRKI